MSYYNMLEKDGKYHYTWVKSLNRLLYDQTKHKEKKYFCERCLHGYSRQDLLEGHKEDCRGVGQTAIRIDMPKEDKYILKFEHYCNQMPVPYVIYADFEALIKPIENTNHSNNKCKTQEHIPCGFGYIVVRYDGKTNQPMIYRGPDAAGKMQRESS